jgi:hypothetical protein
MDELQEMINTCMANPTSTGIIMTSEQKDTILESVSEEELARCLGDAIKEYQKPVVLACGSKHHLHMMAPYHWIPTRIERWLAEGGGKVLWMVGMGTVIGVHVYYRPLDDGGYAIMQVGLVLHD